MDKRIRQPIRILLHALLIDARRLLACGGGGLVLNDEVLEDRHVLRAAAGDVSRAATGTEDEAAAQRLLGKH
jgi:hypothetical protein